MKINAWNDHNDKSLYPGSSTISIFRLIPLQEVRRIAFTDRQHPGRPYFHGSGGGGGVPSCTFFPKGVTASYRSTNIHVLTTRWASHINILFFIQFILYMFYDDFWRLFDTIFCSLYYSYFYYMYIVILSYSRLYC